MTFAAAVASRRVRLGTVLIISYRNPVVTAKMAASLDALRGGRVILGIGAGWVAAERAACGPAQISVSPPAACCVF